MKKHQATTNGRRPFGSIAIKGTALCLTSILLSKPTVAQTQPTSGGGLGQPPAQEVMVQSKTDKNVRFIQFRTGKGQINLVLPAEIAMGDTVSGIITRTPVGKSAGDKDKNQDFLRGYRVELASTPPLREDADRQRAVWTLSTPITIGFVENGGRRDPSISVVMRDSRNGQELAQTTMPVMRVGKNAQQGQEKTLKLPQTGKAGELLSIPGNFDGDAATTNVRLGNQAVVVLAESPRVCVVQTPKQALGKTQVTLTEGSGSTATVQGNFDHQKARRRGISGWLIAGVLVGLYFAAIVIAIAANPGMGATTPNY